MIPVECHVGYKRLCWVCVGPQSAQHGPLAGFPLGCTVPTNAGNTNCLDKKGHALLRLLQKQLLLVPFDKVLYTVVVLYLQPSSLISLPTLSLAEPLVPRVHLNSTRATLPLPLRHLRYQVIWRFARLPANSILANPTR